MFYLQLMLGAGVGLLGIGLVYFLSTNRLSSSMPHGNNSPDLNRSSFDHDQGDRYHKKRRKARPGEMCPFCLQPMSEENMRFLICEHAMHHFCYDECRKVRKHCLNCGTKYAELSEEGDDCAICLCQMSKENMEYLKCEHALHISCLRKYKVRGSRICPLCRKSI